MAKPEIRLHNTLTQQLEPLSPAIPGEVRIYACGLTTYAPAHAGHARANTTYDVLVRFLRVRGLRVTFVRNVTDVDDKILARSRELGEEPMAFSRRMSELNASELAAIGCLAPDREPRVSEHIAEIVALIETLIAKEHAYVAPTAVGNDVYFAVRSFPGYGKLSGRRIDDLQVGARVEASETKRDPLDFALWKASGEGDWGWPSPWGKGRPGWHIECSAMSAKYLSPHFDIHCGGMDLIFPHHENEIAQSEAAWGAPFAKHWVHNGFLTVDQEKMSKSLGNFVTIGDVLERNDPEALRYFILGTHYRGPLAFDVDRRENGRVVFPGVDEAERRVEYLYATRDGLRGVAAVDGGETKATPKAFVAAAKLIAEAEERVLAALDKDLNTPVALAVLGELAKVGNDLVTQAGKLKKDPSGRAAVERLAAQAVAAFDRCVAPLGLMQAPNDVFHARTQERRQRLRGLSPALIDGKLAARNAAREARDFQQSDRIRAELAALGVEILDTPAGSSWRITL